MSDNETNFYNILGVSNTASDAEIKKAYRALSLKYHPDRNPTPDAAKMIRNINDAYETLGDSAKRKQYDMEQSMESLFGGGGGPFMRTQSMNDPAVDILNMMFGGMGGPFGGGMPGGMPEIRIFHGGMGMPHPMFQTKPPPLQHIIRISYTQAYTGCNVPIVVNRWVMIGDTKINEEETVYVSIPAGIDENEMIVLQGKGNTASEELKGDVKVSIQLHNDTPFQRQGLDLIYRKKISLKEALCGFAFEIPHLNGKMLALNNTTNVNIVKPNFKKIVKGLGFSRQNTAGNLIIEFDIEFPDSLTAEQIEKISELL
jgi:DnaJ homolog subfamily B member 4